MAKAGAAGVALAMLAGLSACGESRVDVDPAAAAAAAKAAAEIRRAEIARAEEALDGLTWEVKSVEILPARADGDCIDRPAKLYDSCGSQAAIFEDALRRAADTGKAQVVVYGAEWCIWCHIFYYHLDGEYGEFNYNLEGRKRDMREPIVEVAREDVMALNGFAAENLLLAYISDDAEDGLTVLERAGVLESFEGELPFIFSVDARGRAVKILGKEAVVSRRTLFSVYDGYDRRKLLAGLEVLARLARASAPAPPLQAP